MTPPESWKRFLSDHFCSRYLLLPTTYCLYLFQAMSHQMINQLRNQNIGFFKWDPKIWLEGSGCGSVGRAVASSTRGLRFESSHRQKFIYLYWTFVYCQLCIGKTKIKKKRPGMAHFLKIWLEALVTTSGVEKCYLGAII